MPKLASMDFSVYFVYNSKHIFEDPNLMTLICHLQYPSQKNNVYLQGNSSFHKICIPFLVNDMLIVADLNNSNDKLVL